MQLHQVFFEPGNSENEFKKKLQFAFDDHSNLSENLSRMTFKNDASLDLKFEIGSPSYQHQENHQLIVNYLDQINQELTRYQFHGCSVSEFGRFTREILLLRLVGIYDLYFVSFEKHSDKRKYSNLWGLNLLQSNVDISNECFNTCRKSLNSMCFDQIPKKLSFDSQKFLVHVVPVFSGCIDTLNSIHKVGRFHGDIDLSNIMYFSLSSSSSNNDFGISYCIKYGMDLVSTAKLIGFNDLRDMMLRFCLKVFDLDILDKSCNFQEFEKIGFLLKKLSEKGFKSSDYSPKFGLKSAPEFAMITNDPEFMKIRNTLLLEEISMDLESITVLKALQCCDVWSFGAALLEFFLKYLFETSAQSYNVKLFQLVETMNNKIQNNLFGSNVNCSQLQNSIDDALDAIFTNLGDELLSIKQICQKCLRVLPSKRPNSFDVRALFLSCETTPLKSEFDDMIFETLRSTSFTAVIERSRHQFYLWKLAGGSVSMVRQARNFVKTEELNKIPKMKYPLKFIPEFYNQHQSSTSQFTRNSTRPPSSSPFAQNLEAPASVSTPTSPVSAGGMLWLDSSQIGINSRVYFRHFDIDLNLLSSSLLKPSSVELSGTSTGTSSPERKQNSPNRSPLKNHWDSEQFDFLPYWLMLERQNFMKLWLNFVSDASINYPDGIPRLNSTEDRNSLALIHESLPEVPALPFEQRSDDVHYQSELLDFFGNKQLSFSNSYNLNNGGILPTTLSPAMRLWIGSGIIRQSQKPNRVIIDLPRPLLSKLWACLLDVDLFKDTRKHDMAEFDIELERQLDLDLPRCHPYHALLSNPIGRQLMRNIIRRLLKHNKDIVYWQGLDSLVAPFLIVCASNLPINPTDILMLGPNNGTDYAQETENFGFRLAEQMALNLCSKFIKSYMPGIFSYNNSNCLNANLNLFKLLMNFIDPKLGNHLNHELGFTPDLYCIPWLLTMFSHSLPIGKTIQLWSHILTRPLKVPSYLLFICLGFICYSSELRNQLLAADFSECMQILGSGNSIGGGASSVSRLSNAPQTINIASLINDLEKICNWAWEKCLMIPLCCFHNQNDDSPTSTLNIPQHLPTWSLSANVLRVSFDDLVKLANKALVIDTRPTNTIQDELEFKWPNSVSISISALDNIESGKYETKKPDSKAITNDLVSSIYVKGQQISGSDQNKQLSLAVKKAFSVIKKTQAFYTVLAWGGDESMISGLEVFAIELIKLNVPRLMILSQNMSKMS